MKKIVTLAIPALLAVIVFAPIENRIIYWSLFVFLFILVYIYHVIEDVVPMNAVSESLSSNDYFSLKCGYISVNGNRADLIKGVMVIFSGTILFYVRASAGGGARLAQTIAGESIENYTIGKVDDFHQGICFTLGGGEEVKFTGRKFAQQEKEMRKALGWPEEAEIEPGEPLK